MPYGRFTLLLVAALIRSGCDKRDGYPFHYRWLYVIATSFIMAYAAKESIYLTTAVLGSFIVAMLAVEVISGYWWIGPGAGLLVMAGGLISGRLGLAVLGALIILAVLLLQMWATGRSGLIADALRTSPWRAWVLSASIVVALFVFLYWPVGDPATWAFVPGTHMVPTTLDVPVAGGNDITKSYNYSTDGLLGGLQYWQAQQPVARGGQPWYYYFLIIPMYEWFVTLFGIIGAIYILRRFRTFWSLFILWWTFGTFAIYCWTSEKMPWNIMSMCRPRPM
jgi:predicted membrane-bound mannosyltransferase